MRPPFMRPSMTGVERVAGANAPGPVTVAADGRGRALAPVLEAPALTAAADEDPAAAVGGHVAVELLGLDELRGRQPVEAVGARGVVLLDRPAGRRGRLGGQAVARRCRPRPPGCPRCRDDADGGEAEHAASPATTDDACRPASSPARRVPRPVRSRFLRPHRRRRGVRARSVVASRARGMADVRRNRTSPSAQCHDSARLRGRYTVKSRIKANKCRLNGAIGLPDVRCGRIRGMSPELSVVICTRDRPVLLRRALEAIRTQTFAGVIETVVVFDRSEPDQLPRGRRRPPAGEGGRQQPHPGPARRPQRRGGRRPRRRSWPSATTTTSGCPRRRRSRCESCPPAPTSTSWSRASRSRSTGATVDRALDQAEVTFPDLLESRLMEVNFCTAMVRRDAFLDRIGPADEHIPGGYAEDYEWVLRASRVKPIAVVPEPLVIVEWHAQSFFASALAGHRRRARLPRRGVPGVPVRAARARPHPGAALVRAGRARPAHATRGRRSGRRFEQNWREPRAYLAGVVATGLVRVRTRW